MLRPRVLLVGSERHPEFVEAVDLLRRQTDYHSAPRVSDALSRIDDAPAPPDLVVIAQSRAGQFSHEQVSALRRAVPLTRIAALLGSWCEGESRTGRPWPGTTRLYWHQWIPWFARELDRLSDGKCPTWGLPVTATADEMIDFSIETNRPSSGGLVAIRAGHACTYDALADACRSAGYATVWLRDDQHVQVQGPCAVIWDDTHCGERQAARIAAAASAVRPAPLVALFHFLRIHDRQRALAAGAAAALSKPILIDDLFWYLQRPA
jgi:hypothetical protein